MVGYITCVTYGDIDVNKQPCIFPRCGHIMTVESMDGHMGMQEYYESDAEGSITGLKGPLRYFTGSDIKTCPTCRYSLREVQRYNRIVRKILLEENTKKFISWSQDQYVQLAKAVEAVELDLRDNPELVRDDAAKYHDDPTAEQVTGEPRIVQLAGKGDTCIGMLRAFSPLKRRYFRTLDLRKKLLKHLQEVSENEQPFHKVYDLVQNYKRCSPESDVSFTLDQAALQTRQRLLAQALAIRLDLLIFSDALLIRTKKSGFVSRGDWLAVDVTVDFSYIRKTCVQLVLEATHRQQPMVQGEALVYFARFAGLELTHRAGSHEDPELKELRTAGQNALVEVKLLRASNPTQTAGLADDIDAAESMLRDLTFYSPVSSAERKQILEAMSHEFSSTGHWYACPNGHPYTIGECGGAMQESRCPICNEQIGGVSHRLAERNQALDIEEDFGRLDL